MYANAFFVLVKRLNYLAKWKHCASNTVYRMSMYKLWYSQKLLKTFIYENNTKLKEGMQNEISTKMSFQILNFSTFIRFII